MLYFFAVVCPPLAVAIAGKSKQAWWNLLLTVCLWVPGVVHAFRVIKEGEGKHDVLHAYEPKNQDELRELSYSLPRIK